MLILCKFGFTNMYEELQSCFVMYLDKVDVWISISVFFWAGLNSLFLASFKNNCKYEVYTSDFPKQGYSEIYISFS